MKDIQEFVETYELKSFLYGDDNMINEAYGESKFKKFCRKIWNFLTGKREEDDPEYYNNIRLSLNPSTDENHLIPLNPKHISKFIPRGSLDEVLRVVNKDHEGFPQIYNMFINTKSIKDKLELKNITNYVDKSKIKAAVILYDVDTTEKGISTGFILWADPEDLNEYRKLFDDKDHDDYAHIFLCDVTPAFDEKNIIRTKLVKGCFENIKYNKDIKGVTVYAGCDKKLEKTCLNEGFKYYDEQKKYMYKNKK